MRREISEKLTALVELCEKHIDAGRDQDAGALAGLKTIMNSITAFKIHHIPFEAMNHLTSAEYDKNIHAFRAHVLAANASIIASDVKVYTGPADFETVIIDTTNQQIEAMTVAVKADGVSKIANTDSLLRKVDKFQRYDIAEKSGNPWESYRCIEEDSDGDYLRREDVIRLLGGDVNGQ